MSRAKYTKGAQVRSLDLLLGERSVYWRDKLIPVAFVIGMPMRCVARSIHEGHIRYADPKEAVWKQ